MTAVSFGAGNVNWAPLIIKGTVPFTTGMLLPPSPCLNVVITPLIPSQFILLVSVALIRMCSVPVQLCMPV